MKASAFLNGAIRPERHIRGTHTGDDQSHWVVSGTLELDVAGYGIIRLSRGDRDFMPANTEHAATVIGDEPVVYLIGAR